MTVLICIGCLLALGAHGVHVDPHSQPMHSAQAEMVIDYRGAAGNPAIMRRGVVPDGPPGVAVPSPAVPHDARAFVEGKQAPTVQIGARPEVTTVSTTILSTIPDNLFSYNGPQGFTGAQGPQGAEGLPGPPGKPGEDGSVHEGPAGAQGEMGTVGSPGVPGPPGKRGAQGRTGRVYDSMGHAANITAIAKELLRHTDTMAQSHDQASQMLMDQMAAMEKELSLEDSDVKATEAVLTAEEKLGAAREHEQQFLNERVDAAQKQLILHRQMQAGMLSRIDGVDRRIKTYSRPGLYGGSGAPHGFGDSRLAQTLALVVTAVVTFTVPASGF